MTGSGPSTVGGPTPDDARRRARLASVSRSVFVLVVAAVPFLPLLDRLTLPYIADSLKGLALLLLVAVVLTLWAIELVWDWRSARPRAFFRPARGLGFVLGLLAVWLAVVGLSARLSILPALSQAGAPQPDMGVVMVVAWAVLFIEAVRRAERETIHAVLRSVIWAGTAAALVGLVQYLNLGLVTFEVLQHGRATGVFGSSIVLGGFLALCAPVALAYALRLREGVEQRLVLLAWFAIILGLAVSGTRGAWVAAGTAAVLVAAMSVWGGEGASPRVRQRLVTAALALVAAALLISVLPANTAGTVAERASSIGIREPSLQARTVIWQTSTRAFAHRPLFGWGPDTTFYVMPRFETLSWLRVFRDPGTTASTHNLELQILLEYGLIGLVAFVAFVSGCLWVAIRRFGYARGATRALLATMLGALLGLALHMQLAWVTSDVVAIAWVLLGLAVGVGLRTGGGTEVPEPKAYRAAARAVAGALLAAAFVAVVLPSASRALAANYYVTLGRRTFYSAPTSEAQAAGIEHLKSALRTYPDQADARDLLGRFYGAEYLATGPSKGPVAQRLRRLAVGTLLSAIRRNPYDLQAITDYVEMLWSERSLLGRRSKTGRLDEGLAEIIAYSRRGLALEPWSPVLRRSLVTAYLESGEPEKARAEAKFLRLIDPNDPALKAPELSP